MTCAFARALLDLYCEGRLSESRAAEVKAHLESCAACAGLVPPRPKSVPPLQAPQGLKERLRKSLTAEDAEGAEGRRGAKRQLSEVAAADNMRSLPLATLTLVVAWVGLMWLAHAATVMWPTQQGDAAGQAFTVRRLP